MKVWESISSWLGGGISVVVYLFIIALFLIGVFSCLIPVSNNRKRLKKAIELIKQGDKAKRSWQEDRFLGKGNLMPHWSEYLNNLFFANGEYHNPANVEDYINEETVIDTPGKSKLAEALPGLQVSLGFLGTLLGLSLALSEMSAVDASNITTSMNTLLSSMKYAFLTSIFGVVASVLFTLLTRAVHSKAQATLVEFYNAMARYAGVLSVDPLTQVAIYQQEQTVLLRDMAKSITPESLRTLFDPIAKTMDASYEGQQKLMNEVADAYINKLNTALHGQLEALSSTIESTCRYQEKTVKSVSDALVEFSSAARAIHDIREDADKMLSGLQNALSRLEQTANELRQSDSEARGVMNAQTECIDALNALTGEISGQVEKTNAATAIFLEGAQRLTDASAETLSQAGEALSG
ncbi:MAG: MotA/TolQ/ExbB proton channel family protein, partial [Clostridia bacterium]|nr:MotA/TolQ/ExbB proton channel family protein [Clostridia bacterium]